MKTAKIKIDFLTLFLYRDEIENGCVEIDYDCLYAFEEGDMVEILREIPKSKYANNQKSYVILNPANNESVTIAEAFLDFNI